MRGASRGPRSWAWATLMRRAVGIDLLACPRCGGRLRLIATVEDPAVGGKILAPLRLLHPARSDIGLSVAYAPTSTIWSVDFVS